MSYYGIIRLFERLDSVEDHAPRYVIEPLDPDAKDEEDSPTT